MILVCSWEGELERSTLTDELVDPFIILFISQLQDLLSSQSSLMGLFLIEFKSLSALFVCISGAKMTAFSSSE